MIRESAKLDSTWINCEDDLPESGKPVLFVINRNGEDHIHLGAFIKEHTEEIPVESDCDFDYCEEKDLYFLKEGWYEQSYYHYEYKSWSVDDLVIKWQELPKVK